MYAMFELPRNDVIHKLCSVQNPLARKITGEEKNLLTGEEPEHWRGTKTDWRGKMKHCRGTPRQYPLKEGELSSYNKDFGLLEH